jgi:hypothetical protein
MFDIEIIKKTIYKYKFKQKANRAEQGVKAGEVIKNKKSK